MSSQLPAQPSRQRADWLLWDQCHDRKDLAAFLDRVSLFADAVRATSTHTESAELAELREACRMTQDHLRLAKFYGVKTYAGLAQAQANHIARLQAKLPPTPSLAPQRARKA